MLVTGTKSKPVYAPGVPDHGGKYHLLLAQRSSGEALLRLLSKMPQGSVLSGTGRYSRETAHTHVLYTTGTVSGKNHADQLLEPGVAELKIYPKVSELLPELRPLLSRCAMGTRLYIAARKVRSARSQRSQWNLI